MFIIHNATVENSGNDSKPFFSLKTNKNTAVMNSSSNNIDYGRVIKSGLSKRSMSSTRAVNLKYENSTYNNPFSVSNWPLNSSHGNYSALNNVKANNLLRDRLVPNNFQHISNTNLLISNYLDSQSTKHKYFPHPQKNPSIYGLNIVKSDIQAKPQTPRDNNNNNSSKPQTPRAQSHKASAHPILNNGFLKPQVVPSTPSNKAELLNTSVSSMSTTIHNRQNNSVATNRRAKTGRPLQHPITSTVATDRSNSTPSSTTNAPITDPALGSKNARDAFFERLRVTEYLNKSTSALDNNSGRIQSDQSSTNSSYDLNKPTKKVYDMKKMQYIANLTESLLDNDSSRSSANSMSQLNNQFNNGYQSSSNMFSKPYSAKSNFSNVTKIDKQFKKQPEINNVDHAYFFSNMNANKTVNSSYNSTTNTNNNSNPVQNDDLEPSSSSASSDKTTVDEADDLFQKAYSQTLNEKLDKVNFFQKLH